MKIGLGIDTGGTYTDAVLIDRETKKPLFMAKSPTTHEDLSIGVAGALEKLPSDLLQQAEMVSLSTTLATNACVEGKGGRAAVILLGYDERLVTRLAGDYGLDVETLPIIKGTHGQRGQVVEEPDADEIAALARRLAPNLDAIGVAEYWGVRNPEFERTAKEILLRETGLPVAAAHELTNEVNSLKRAATTMLNARLIPVATALMRAVRAVLSEKQIDARMMVVRGDGALMSEEYALSHPVETLLSGPAASVAGGFSLSGEKDCVVIDIGGTTSDIAVVRGGRAALTETGVRVGAWRTGTKTISVRTEGLGGDTRILLGKDKNPLLDVKRAMPVSRLATQFPAVLTELEALQKDPQPRGYSRAEFLLRVREPSRLSLDREEKRIVEALREKPLSVESLAAAIGTRAYFMRTERLESLGVLLRSALTITDLWHVTGEFSRFDAKAAKLAAEILAEQAGLTVDALIQNAFSQASERLYRHAAAHLIERANPKIDSENTLSMAFSGVSDEIAVQVNCSMPIVGIGAPAARLLTHAAEKLHAKLVCAPCADVGGAIGAVVGPILSEARVLIRPLHEAWGVDGYACHAPDELREFDDYEEAVEWSRATAAQSAAAEASAMGALNVVCEISLRESVGRSAGRESVALHLETEVTALASGRA